ncbi:hypothetical protein BH11PAT2_BH11PAT2_04000 [soil metagenome]
MKKTEEKVLSAILLKYYKRPKRNEDGGPWFICSWCFEKSDRTGGGYIDTKGKPQQICETCAVWRYKEDYGFKTLGAARARRRRIFDVGYLFNEAVIDVYLDERGITFESCGNADKIFLRASGLYNKHFSREGKIHLEELEHQKEIEAEIQRKLFLIDFEKVFADL